MWLYKNMSLFQKMHTKTSEGAGALSLQLLCKLQIKKVKTVKIQKQKAKQTGLSSESRPGAAGRAAGGDPIAPLALHTGSRGGPVVF